MKDTYTSSPVYISSSLVTKCSPTPKYWKYLLPQRCLTNASKHAIFSSGHSRSKITWPTQYIFRFRHAYFHSGYDKLCKYYAELRKILSEPNSAWFQMLSQASAAECLAYILDAVMEANPSLAPLIKHWRQITLGDCTNPNCNWNPCKGSWPLCWCGT